MQPALFLLFMDQQHEESKQEKILSLGAWLGRHQAFGLIANRCSAADAECLKSIRDRGEYKELGLSWEQFCEKHAGISRYQANRQIHHLEEFGGNYFRMSEVMAISADTYRLIAAAVTADGIQCGDERIPLVPENRVRIAAVVNMMRSRGEGDAPIGGLRKKLDTLLADARSLGRKTRRRQELIELLEEGREQLQRLSERLREPGTLRS